MKFERYPDEIAFALCKCAGICDKCDKDLFDDLIDAVYDLKAICENDLNNDRYRTTYRILEMIVDRAELLGAKSELYQ